MISIDKIILYSTDCTKCRELKALLKKHNISYTENNSVKEMLELGFEKVPMLSVNDYHMDFKAAKNWINNLNKQGEIE